ncbi:DUF4157 domain-containing protein [Tateyamaria sp.]|uniref:eCIS core domain-containing protein n=1 Tax=Tateyamaria sp. TaxID=1929288 RepID=UPI0032A0433A
MADDEIKKITEKLKGKKAKTKTLKTTPEGTKSIKLPKNVAQGLSDALGADLSKVRVHTGGNVADACKEMGVKAFAMGNELYLAKPADAKNVKLLAHELTHVIQQGGGKKMPKRQEGKASVSK